MKLTKEQESLVEKLLATGKYPSQEAALTRALKLTLEAASTPLAEVSGNLTNESVSRNGKSSFGAMKGTARILGDIKAPWSEGEWWSGDDNL